MCMDDFSNYIRTDSRKALITSIEEYMSVPDILFDHWIKISDFNNSFGFDLFYPIRKINLKNGECAYIGIKTKRIEYTDDNKKSQIRLTTTSNLLGDSFKRNFHLEGRLILFEYDGEKCDEEWDEESFYYRYCGDYYLSKLEMNSLEKNWSLMFSTDPNDYVWKNKKDKDKYDEIEEIIKREDSVNYHIAEWIEDRLSGAGKLKGLLPDFNMEEFKKTDAYYLKINETLFHEMLNLDDRNSNTKKLLLHFKRTVENKDGSLVYEFDAKTREMMEVDSEFYGNKEYVDLVYKPYYYQVFFKYPKNLLDNIPEQLKDMKDNNNYWFEVPVIILKVETNDNSTCIGKLSFAASDYESKDIIVAWDKVVKSINTNNALTVPQNQIISGQTINDYCNTNNDDWADKLKTTLDSIFAGKNNTRSKIDITINRIGEANFIYCKGNRISFAFDFGIPTDDNIVNQAGDCDYTFISDPQYSYHPKLVIISHWHEDHIKGLFLLGKDFWNDRDVLFLAPEFNDPCASESAKKLVNYLRTTGQLIEISNYGKEIYKVGSENILFQGNGDKNNKDDPNPKGLLLQLRHTLLTGDCIAEFWPDNYGVGNKFDVIVLPHHGSWDCVKGGHVSGSLSSSTKKINLIACSGFNNNSNHPNLWIRRNLKRRFNSYDFTLRCTNIKNPWRVYSEREKYNYNPKFTYADA